MTTNEKLLEYAKDGKYEKLIECLNENIREEVVAKNWSGRGRLPKSDSIIKRMMKKIPDYENKFRVNHPAVIDGMEYNCFLDGHRIFMDSEMDYGYPKVDKETKFDVTKFVNLDLYRYKKVEVNRNELDIFIKTHKNEGIPYVIKINEQYIGMNPNFLKDMLDFTETDFIYVELGDSEIVKTPFYSINKDKTKVVMTLPMIFNSTTYSNVNQEVA